MGDQRLHSFSKQKSPADTGDDQNHMQGEKSFVAYRTPTGERPQKKTPSRYELQGGLEQSLAAAYFPT